MKSAVKFANLMSCYSRGYQHFTNNYANQKNKKQMQLYILHYIYEYTNKIIYIIKFKYIHEKHNMRQ